MKNLIAGNWKMNPASKGQAEELIEKISSRAEDFGPSEVVVCPPDIYLNDALRAGVFFVGAQNCFYEEKGAYTGEISAQMIKDLGAEYVIIGHSERRKYFGETDEIVNKKIKKALEAGLKVIFCIGETAEERDAGRKQEVLERQIKAGLEGISQEVNVAYEPVWAIGTGNNCSVQETKETLEFIRKFLPTNTRCLYGGSVKSDNSGAYIKEAGANGLLVGGASLIAEEFVSIVKSAQ